jgi:hypothetical protein
LLLALIKIASLVNEEFDPADAKSIATRLLGHKNKEVCAEKRVINTNTAQITALDPISHTLDALPSTRSWGEFAELRHQALHPTTPIPHA